METGGHIVDGAPRRQAEVPGLDRAGTQIGLIRPRRNCLDRAKMRLQRLIGKRLGGSASRSGPAYGFRGRARRAASKRTCSVSLRSRLRHLIFPGIAALAVAAADANANAVFAQGKLEARYQATVGGLPLGKGTWEIDVRDNQFSASLSGATSGLLQVIASAHGTSAVRGTVSGGQPVGAAFASSMIIGKKMDEVRMLMSGGSVTEFMAEPPTLPVPTRVPITEEHRRNVTDPMTAAMIRAPGSGDTFSPEVCNRKLAIFDGRMRYDLRLSFKRLERVKSEKGYQGNAVVCAVYFSPVAGHVPERAAIKYLVRQRDAEIWLAPIAGTRLMVPYRMSVPTPLGLGVVEATQFVSIPQPTSASSVRPQKMPRGVNECGAYRHNV